LNTEKEEEKYHTSKIIKFNIITNLIVNI